MRSSALAELLLESVGGFFGHAGVGGGGISGSCCDTRLGVLDELEVGRDVRPPAVFVGVPQIPFPVVFDPHVVWRGSSPHMEKCRSSLEGADDPRTADELSEVPEHVFAEAWFQDAVQAVQLVVVDEPAALREADGSEERFHAIAPTHDNTLCLDPVVLDALVDRLWAYALGWRTVVPRPIEKGAKQCEFSIVHERPPWRRQRVLPCHAVSGNSSAPSCTSGRNTRMLTRQNIFREVSSSFSNIPLHDGKPITYTL